MVILVWQLQTYPINNFDVTKHSPLLLIDSCLDVATSPLHYISVVSDKLSLWMYLSYSSAKNTIGLRIFMNRKFSLLYYWYDSEKRGQQYFYR